jgi:transglutaminase-like putative cysteine protease
MKMKTNGTINWRFFCVGVKISRSYWGRNIGLSVFGNRVPRVIFGAKRDKVTEEWRKQHTDEFSDMNS